MRKFSVNRKDKQKPLSNDEINRYKNFSQLSHEYEQITKRPKKPLYQNRKLFLYLLLLGLILYILYIESKK